MILEVLQAAWQTLTAMAPYLLFGFFIAGMLSMFISPSLVETHLGGRGIWPIMKASLLGIPLPLCRLHTVSRARLARRGRLRRDPLEQRAEGYLLHGGRQNPHTAELSAMDVEICAQR